MEWIDTKTIYTILHIFGAIIGAGAAFVSDALFMISIKDKRINITESTFLHAVGVLVWIGIGILLVSGSLLFSLDPAKYLASSKFLLKMIIVLVIIINGAVFHKIHLPIIKRTQGKHLHTEDEYKKRSRLIYISGAISIISWVLTIILGVLRGIPLTLSQGLLLYVAILGIGVVGALLSQKMFFKK